ncbi:hypothetical protein [Halobaculum lipolyticum]|uniref:Uncharacterized protein n=1 Tax=Halobaculum lipolyticum TaxID=3032001 RepID=A0ABD5W4I5_9EURY|nr:hypothetical protein [Halobaculum sp. DT31]
MIHDRTPPAADAAVATLAPPVQADTTVTVQEPLVGVFLATLVLSVVLGAATATLAVVRYRRRGDPSLRAFVVGLVLVAVAPLPFRVVVVGTVPALAREVAPPLFQTAGLLALLVAMYGDPRTEGRRVREAVTGRDAVVVAVALAAAVATVALAARYESNAAALAAAGVVVALSTTVAGQAARAAYRYRSRSMATLSLGVLLLATLPTPVGATMLVVGSVDGALAVGVANGAVLLGEAAMFATLASR